VRKVLDTTGKGGGRCPFIGAAAETLDGFFSPRLDRCLKRVRSDEKEIRWNNLVFVRVGRFGTGRAPLGWAVDNVSTLGS